MAEQPYVCRDCGTIWTPEPKVEGVRCASCGSVNITLSGYEPSAVRLPHIHTWKCTEDSCPGNGFITREQLVERTKQERARREAAGHGRSDPE